MVISLIFTVVIFAAYYASATLPADNNLMLPSVQQQHLATNDYEFEMMDLLGLGNRPVRMKRHPSLRHSASKFLLEVYQEISEEEIDKASNARHRRALSEDNFITAVDREEIEKCNNIITFSGRTTLQQNPHKAMIVNFNTNDVPRDLQLVHAALRIYQDPKLGGQRDRRPSNVTISLRYQVQNSKQHASDLRILTSLNSTTTYRGWHEFNVTHLMGRWLQHRTLHQTTYGGDVLIEATTLEDPDAREPQNLNANNIGLVEVSDNDFQLVQQPFIIGYFNGPELIAKIHTLRFKRDVVKRKRRADFYVHPPQHPIPQVYKVPKTCERLNFTLDFKDLHMHNWVIAPKKFEAYFCGGECNFPLGSKMNATNHAIVQTLMHLKQPNLPKPCCVPTVLGSISLLHYLNEDSVNLSKYPQSVAKECGCH